MAARAQAISGVSAGAESVIETIYPSISASGIGRFLGAILESIPVRIWGIKVSHLLFALPVLPLALVGYFVTKLFGLRYVITNRQVQVWKAFGARLLKQVPLAEISDIELQVTAGQEFYHAGNLLLRGKSGDVLERLEGIPRPERFQHVLLEVRDARLQSDASLNTIRARAKA